MLAFSHEYNRGEQNMVGRTNYGGGIWSGGPDLEGDQIFRDRPRARSHCAKRYIYIAELILVAGKGII